MSHPLAAHMPVPRLPEKRLMAPKTRGILLILASGFCFALMFALPKMATVPLEGLQVTFLRYATGLMTIAPLAAVMAARGTPFRTRQWPVIGLRALCGAATVTAVLYATQHMPFADAMTIGFADGLFVLLLAAIFLRERVSARRWGAAVVCLGGAAMVAQPSPDLLGRVWLEPAAWAAFLGAFFMACEGVLIKVLTHRMSGTVLLFYTNLFATVLLAVPAFVAGDWPGILDLGPYLCMGPIAIAGQFLFLHGLRSADISALVPYKYATLIFAALLGIVLFGQWPPVTTYVGAALIIVSGIYLSRTETRSAR